MKFQRDTNIHQFSLSIIKNLDRSVYFELENECVYIVFVRLL